MNPADLIVSLVVVLLIAWGIGGALVLAWTGLVYGHDWWIRCRERRQFNQLTRGL